jgi:DNA-directed RNA polymerase II subunit RPB1
LLETDGKDLGEIMAHPLVVSSLTITNDINEVWKTLGIEAARAALLYELGEVMREAYANPRHFYMLVDVMCEKGVLTSIDRHGLNRGDTTGPLTKASFEETIDIIRNAGMFAEVDNVNSVAANIMLGQVVKAGTGGAVIHLDETLIGGLPEYFDKAQTSVDVVSTVSDEDLCRTIMRFMYTEPSSSLDIIPKINVPVITYVK